MSKTAIYMSGTVTFGLAYYWLKGLLGEPTFFLMAMVYIVALRLLAERFGHQV